MKIKTMTQSALLLGIGLVLHLIIPSLMGFMKPDFMLIMMLISLFKVSTIKENISIAFIAGLLSGMTSQMPFGLIANVIDKLVVGVFIFCNRKQIKYRVVLTFLGTLISGATFLSVIYLIGQLPRGVWIPLFLSNVIPTAILNVLLMIVIKKKTTFLVE